MSSLLNSLNKNNMIKYIAAEIGIIIKIFQLMAYHINNPMNMLAIKGLYALDTSFNLNPDFLNWYALNNRNVISDTIVANAAPLIPNLGISMRFIIIFARAVNAVLIIVIFCFPMALRRTKSGVLMKLASEINIKILSTCADAMNSCPYIK